MNRKSPSLLAVIGPGLMLAATGVGAVDLVGGAFAGMNLRVAVLWAIVLGTALVGACGVAAHALLPIFENASTAKIVFGGQNGVHAVQAGGGLRKTQPG